MFTRKRLCPYQNHDSSITDQFSPGQLMKKPCLDYSEQLSLGDNVNYLNEIEMAENGMECEDGDRLHENSSPKISGRLASDSEAQEQSGHMDLSHISSLNNNNNINNNNTSSKNDMYITPTDVCHRCQAGESGHFGHIGR